MPTELNVLALIKGAERYVFVYDDRSAPQLLDAFRAQAADPELSLTWFDATVLTRKAHEQQQQAETTDGSAGINGAAGAPRIGEVP